MKKNPLALIVYDRAIKAANEDGSSDTRRPESVSAQSPALERGGWDPFEVWRTRIRPATGRDPRRSR